MGKAQSGYKRKCKFHGSQFEKQKGSLKENVFEGESTVLSEETDNINASSDTLILVTSPLASASELKYNWNDNSVKIVSHWMKPI